MLPILDEANPGPSADAAILIVAYNVFRIVRPVVYGNFSLRGPTSIVVAS